MTLTSRSWIDLGVVLLLSAIGLIGFATAFDDARYVVAGVGGLAVGAGVAVLAARLRLGAILTAAIGAAAYFLLGTAFAVPSEGIAVVVPTLRSLSSLAIGAVFGWADLLTLHAPVALPDYVTAVPYLAGLVVTLVAVTLALRWLPRRRRNAAATAIVLIGPAVLYVAGVLFGTGDPYFAAVRGIAFAVVALVWLAWRQARADRVGTVARSSFLRRRIVGAGSVILAAMIVGALAGAALSPASDHRFVLRQHVQPPFEPLDFASPFAGFRTYTKDLDAKTIFTIRGADAGEHIRLATMDAWNGISWDVAGAKEETNGSGSFSLSGASVAPPPLATVAGSQRITVTIGDYDDVWLPSVGYPRSVELGKGMSPDDFRYNAATGTSVLVNGLRKGDSYTIDAGLQRQPDVKALASTPTARVQLAPVDQVPDVVTGKAKGWEGKSGSPAQQLEDIASAMKTQGYFSHGTASDTVPSPAGQGADRMVTLFTRSSMVGDQEQYATAMALMARSLGYPARVVMGFTVPDGAGKNGSAVKITGHDVDAWVEVAFQGVGWVAYDPTPERTDVPQNQVPQPQNEPQPQVRQPPRTQTDDDDTLSNIEITNDKDKKDDPFVIPGWVWVAGIATLIPLAIIFVPMLVVGIAKSRRRRRRRQGPGDRRAAGAWEELLDQLDELGVAVPSRATTTRAGIARSLDGPLPAEAAGSLATLARATDGVVFGGDAVDDTRADAVWTEAMGVAVAARAARGIGRRLLSRYRLSAVRRWAVRVAGRR